MAKKAASSKPGKRPNINQVRAKIRELAKDHQFDEQILFSFAEFLNGGAFKAVEPSLQELKDAVMAAFNCSSYQELKKNGSFQLFVKDQSLKLTTKEAWLKVHRKFVGLPESERDAIGATSINGVDVLRNFLPWEVFALNSETATAQDIKTAFNELAKEHHPDHNGNSEVFERLKKMRDSLLAAY
ncbi:MAG: molecular chaperone DnaJ [Leptolyngbya sp.]|nr:MAG: molecular chaperone DnaJ [Leptolyngbya sp.]